MLLSDTERVELRNTYRYFTSVFNQTESSAQPGGSKINDASGGLKSKTGKEMVREHLVTVNAFKSPVPGELHPKVIKELAGLISEPLCIVFENSQRTGEVPED